MSENHQKEPVEGLSEPSRDEPVQEKPGWASKEKVLAAGKKFLAENSEFYQRLVEYDRLSRHAE
jgi:hypothetical protein